MEVLDMAVELIRIHQDLVRRRKCIDEYYIYDFDQTWGSTALGFGGCGGAAMTTARTFILIPTTGDEVAYVYFGGRYAYNCPVTEKFKEDLRNHRMASVAERGRYATD